MTRSKSHTLSGRGGRIALGVVAVLAVLAASIAQAAAPQPARDVALSSYEGRWHQIAGTPNQLQRGCASTMMEYAVEGGDRLRVVHRCERSGKSPRTTRLNARILDPGNNAKVRMTYAGFITQEYWILYQNNAAGWGIVGDPTGRYVWIMSRSAALPDVERDRSFAKLREFGYDLSRVKG